MTAAGRPLVVGVAELLRAPGTQHPVRLTTPAEGLEISGSSVPAGSEVVLELTVESTLGEAVTVHGTLRGTWTGECRRCLVPLEGTLETEVTELFERELTDEESYPIVEDEIDLAPMVHDLLVLALPQLPLCRQECPGPSPESYPVTTAEDGGARPDPRWAALDDLRFDDAGDEPGSDGT